MANVEKVVGGVEAVASGDVEAGLQTVGQETGNVVGGDTGALISDST